MQFQTAAFKQRSSGVRSIRQPLKVAASIDFCRDKVSVPKQVESKGVTYKLTFVNEGEQAVTIDCPDNEYILNVADQNGIDLPATCRGGICGACVARVRSGKVDQSDVADLAFTLSDDEVEQGMALLCMSRACSDMVIETQCDWGYSLGVCEWKGPSGRLDAEPEPLMGTKWNE